MHAACKRWSPSEHRWAEPHKLDTWHNFAQTVVNSSDNRVMSFSLAACCSFMFPTSASIGCNTLMMRILMRRSLASGSPTDQLGSFPLLGHSHRRASSALCGEGTSRFLHGLSCLSFWSACVLPVVSSSIGILTSERRQRLDVYAKVSAEKAAVDLVMPGDAGRRLTS